MTVSKKRQLEIEERRKLVAANLLSGLNYRDMAEALDVSLGTIAKDVKVIIGRLQREQAQDTKEVVALEVRRLDRVVNGIWKKVLEGDLAAIDRFLRVSERRSKLLGLETQTIELTKSVKEMTDDELTQLIAALKDQDQGDASSGPGTGEAPEGSD